MNDVFIDTAVIQAEECVKGMDKCTLAGTRSRQVRWLLCFWVFLEPLKGPFPIRRIRVLATEPRSDAVIEELWIATFFDI